MKYKKVTIYIRHNSEEALDQWVYDNIIPALKYQSETSPMIGEDDMRVEEIFLKSCSKFK